MRHILPTVAVLFFAIAMAPAQDQAVQLDQYLRDQYQGKTFLLRSFYSGDHLRYDSAGSVIGRAASGDWTADGFVQLNDVRISGQRLIVQAKRLFVVAGDGKGFRFFADTPQKRANKERKTQLDIEIDLGPGNTSAELIETVMSRVFLTAHDDFAEMVPDYWKACVSMGLLGKDTGCRFLPEFTAIPGLAHSERSPAPTSPAVGLSREELHGRGDGVTAPRVIHQLDPKFTGAADKVKWQGMVALKLVVDQTGVPRDIYVIAPLGCGLDAEAVRTAGLWRFKPAEKHGQAVAVELVLEMDFHRY
jgi:TonB family protein